MKSKDFSRKLVLNKNTVANLSVADLKGVKGGVDLSLLMSCYTCLGSVCPFGPCRTTTYDPNCQ
jgi:hypothetical protein